MPEVLREVGTERASTGDEDGRWSFSPVRVLRLAQDQYSIDVVRGDYAEVYYARRATHIDAQSEVTAAPALRLMDSAWQALLRLWQADRGHDRWWEDSFSSPELPCGLTEDCDGQSLPAEVDIPALEAEEIMQRLTGSVEWAELRDVILQAEDIEFTVDQSQQIAPRLLELAQCHRDSSDPQDRPVVWAAIRTGASMLRSTDAARLLPLL